MKAKDLMSLSFLGRLILLREEHSRKVPSRISVTPVGIEISERFSHPAKAYSPMDVHFEFRGNTTCLRDLQSKKAKGGMCLMSAGMVTTVSPAL